MASEDAINILENDFLWPIAAIPRPKRIDALTALNIATKLIGLFFCKLYFGVFGLV